MMKETKTQSLKGIVNHLTDEIERLEKEVKIIDDESEIFEQILNNCLFEYLPLGIIVMNNKLEITRCNTIFEKDLNLNSDKIIGQNIKILVDGLNDEVSFELISEKSHIDQKIYAHTNQKHLSINLHNIYSETKKDDFSVLGIIKDITFNDELSHIADEFKF